MASLQLWISPKSPPRPGTLTIGAVAVPVNSRYKPQELGHIITNSGYEGLFVSGDQSEYVDFHGLLAATLPSLNDAAESSLALRDAPALRHIVTIGPLLSEGGFRWGGHRRPRRARLATLRGSPVKCRGIDVHLGNHRRAKGGHAYPHGPSAGGPNGGAYPLRVGRCRPPVDCAPPLPHRWHRFLVCLFRGRGDLCPQRLLRPGGLVAPARGRTLPRRGQTPGVSRQAAV
ncbi:MAG: hypothetical protein KatS3mg011_2254 [Acidimicrobiia bacterium]|nr:MAG: hypothetical protein KatS3mg011_2254 [Acidimicrobiia bacterium]